MACPMLRSRYFQPDAIVAGESDTALPLAGRSDLAFFRVEIAERTGRGVERKQHDTDGLPSEARERLTSARAPFAGLAMDRPRLMGIVNVTPDSFSDGGMFTTSAAAVDHALRLIEAGADMLDIGGESTRPGSESVPLAEELRRVLPVLEAVCTRTKTPISIDTRKAEIMRRAAQSGASIINDVSALTFDPEAPETVADAGCSVVLMHAQGDPKTMQDSPRYNDVALDVFDYLDARIAACTAAGIPHGRIAVDPGIGFGKTLAHNLELLRRLALFHDLGMPIVLGASRKRFIGKLTGEERAENRDPGSHAAMLAGVARGAQIIRVHDVAGARQALSVWEALAAPGNAAT